MKKITAEETTFFYFSKRDTIPRSETIGGIPVVGSLTTMYPVDNFMLEKLEDATDFRLIFVKRRVHLKPHSQLEEAFILSYLYWVTSINLDDLDAKVKNDSFTDQDFHNAVKVYSQVTFCTFCDWRGNTLVFAAADIYVDSPNLYPQKHQKASPYTYKKCPQCDTPLRLPVLKIFD